eukprot:scaffold519270_cov43-Prasinocladus_malaysianus.AAC.1
MSGKKYPAKKSGEKRNCSINTLNPTAMAPVALIPVRIREASMTSYHTVQSTPAPTPDTCTDTVNGRGFNN